MGCNLTEVQWLYGQQLAQWSHPAGAGQPRRGAGFVFAQQPAQWSHPGGAGPGVAVLSVESHRCKIVSQGGGSQERAPYCITRWRFHKKTQTFFRSCRRNDLANFVCKLRAEHHSRQTKNNFRTGGMLTLPRVTNQFLRFVSVERCKLDA